MTTTKASPPKVGTRWQLTRNVDRYPHFIAPEGAEGTITSVDEYNICLRMDDHLPGAEEWDNEVCWSRENDPETDNAAVAFAADVEKAAVRKVSKLLETTWCGGKGSSQDFHLDSRSDGERVIVHRWFEDGENNGRPHKAGEVIIRRIFGSGWRPKPGREIVEYSHVALQNPSDELVVATVQMAVASYVSDPRRTFRAACKLARLAYTDSPITDSEFAKQFELKAWNVGGGNVVALKYVDPTHVVSIDSESVCLFQTEKPGNCAEGIFQMAEDPWLVESTLEGAI